MSFWTLKISAMDGSAATEARLEAYDVVGLNWTTRNAGQDELTLVCGARSFSGTSPWPAGKRARIYLRPESATPGVPDYGAGAKFFDGVVTNEGASNSATAKRREVKILGPWYWFKLPFLQEWKNGGVRQYMASHVMLFADPDADLPGHGQLITVAQQMEAIVRWYKDSGAPLDLDLSVPWEPAGLYLPILPARDISGETALRMCLEKAPQVCCRWNYAAEPPTIRFFDPTSAAELARRPARSFGPGEWAITESGLVRRSDLVTSAVQINYEVVNQVDGVTRITPFDPANGTVDIYPLEAWDAAEKRMKSSYLLDGGFVQTVDLQGSQVTLLKGPLVCELHALTTKAWWQWVKPSLAAPSMTSWDFYSENPTPVVAVDMDTGLEVSLETLAADYPYRIVDGEFAEWMKTSAGVAGRAIRVRVALNYEFERAGVKKGQEFEHFEFTATNLPTGQYWAPSSVVAAEPIPTGLAQYFYGVMSAERYEGELTLVERELTQAVTAGDVVNITGGDAAWASMNAVAQSASYDLATRKTTVRLGMPPFLGVQQRCDLGRLFRIRRVWINPAAQRDATKVGSAGPVQFPGRATYANNQGDPIGETHLLRVGTEENYATLAGEDSKLTIYATTDDKQILVEPGDLPAGARAKFRQVCVLVSGAQKTAWALMTEPV